MPGMTSGVGTGNTLIAEAFRSALRHQLLIVAAIFPLFWLTRLIAASSWPMPGRPGTGRAEPHLRSLAAVRAFDRQEGVSRMSNWLFMTGSLAQLKKVWLDYGMTAQDLPAGAMTLHNDLAYVIGRDGHIREVINTDPGPGTAASRSSFAVELADAARQALGA